MTVAPVVEDLGPLDGSRMVHLGGSVCVPAMLGMGIRMGLGRMDGTHFSEAVFVCLSDFGWSMRQIHLGPWMGLQMVPFSPRQCLCACHALGLCTFWRVEVARYNWDFRRIARSGARSPP